MINVKFNVPYLPINTSTNMRQHGFFSRISIAIVAIGLMVLPSVSVKANPVDVQTARKVAATLLKSYGMKGEPHSLVDITAETPFTEFYVFSLGSEGGFVIVSGDDNTEPVLGYSLTNTFSLSDMPDHVRMWLEGYQKEIRHNAKCGKVKSTRQMWEKMLDGEMPRETKASVSPMLSTTWTQSPYYNNYCPYDSVNGGRAVSGCTAIATAQIMKYFRYPISGYGSATYTHPRLGQLSADYGNTFYLWDSMPVALSATSSSVEVDAVATIVYHVGVAVNMDYSANGSGGKTASYGYGGEASSENALKYNFKYSPYIWTAFRIDYTLTEWKNLMKNELNNGRPILYAGYDEVQSGHAFVLDGYTAQGLFHINWGWGGSYDGYYKVNNLNPTSTSTGPSDYHFDLFATATIGITPFPEFGASTTTVTTGVEGIGGASSGDGSVSGAGTYSFGDTIILTATALNEYTRFVQWSDGCKYNPRGTVATGGEVNFVAQFAPVKSDTVRYHTCDNAMNRASNLPAGLGCDSVWGIRIPASALRAHHDLTGVMFMGRKEGTHTLSVYRGTDSPSQLAYTATFVDSLDYAYTWHTHTLSEPVEVDGTESLWIVLKCTDVDTPGVFSIYGGNPNSMLSGSSLTPMADSWKFSWMIEGLFTWDGTPVGIGDVEGGDMNVELYPNPARGTVSLHGITGNATVGIIDAAGRVIDVVEFDGGENGSTLTVDTSRLLPGAYIVRIVGLHSTVVKKLIVR